MSYMEKLKKKKRISKGASCCPESVDDRIPIYKYIGHICEGTLNA